MQYGKNEFSDTLVLTGIGSILVFIVNRVKYVPPLAALR